MADNLQTSSEPGLGSLISGIISDSQELIKQQLALFKQELKDDARKMREAVPSLLLGGAVLLIGVGLFCMTLVYLLNHATGWELWVCYLIVSLLASAIGAGVIYAIWHQFRSLNPVSDTVKSLEENLEWKTKPR